MFFTKKNGKAQKRLLEQAKFLVNFAKKVVHYRKDVLGEVIVSALVKEREQLEGLCARMDDTADSQKAVERQWDVLDKLMRKHGGTIYPLHFWNENIEIILVAAILAIGVRAFFFQPFKIPTNSMYPTYSGMRPHVYLSQRQEPNFFQRAFRFAAFGASFYSIKAPESGELKIPLFSPKNHLPRMGEIEFTVTNGRRLFGFWTKILPKPYREYTFYVGGEPIVFRVPYDFYGVEEVVMESFFQKSGQESLGDALKQAMMDGRIDYEGDQVFLKTGLRFQKGDAIARFDIMTGDMLFVDRFSYHFRQPRIGEAIVFRTENIPQLADQKYYIKRLVGQSGDVLEIREPTLFRNGQPISGAKAFDLNAKKVGEYPGYVPRGHLSQGDTETIPAGNFYAMGDNSPYSGDSRYWGFVPEKEVVGKAFFVLYPFTSRWGRAR